MTLVLSGCQCGIDLPPPDEDAGIVDAGVRPRDGGHVVIPPEVFDAGWAKHFAGEECPPETYGNPDGGSGAGAYDGGFRLGICIVLHTLSADAQLDGMPDTKPVLTRFQGSNYQSELTRTPSSQGQLQVKVMRSRYDILRHQPGGVWPYFEGFIDHGFTDMTSDQARSFAATSHLLRGAVRFGGLPFVPNGFPQDVWFEAYGTPDWQQSMVTSNGGSYELRLLEGVFALYLSTPALSLYGTELRKFPVTPGRGVAFDQDQEFDVDIPTSVLEARLTIDGMPLPDARPGTDFSLTYARPGDSTATVFSHHEGGVPTITSLVPRATYGITFDFQGAPNRTYPSRIFSKQIRGGVDLTHDTSLVADFTTKNIEGGILVDGVSPPSNPAYNFQLFMYSVANQTQTGAFVVYEVPMDTAAFNIKAFPGLYFVALSIDEGLSPNLASGFWVVDRFYEHNDDSSMPIAIETVRFSGRISIDDQTPVPNRRVGVLTFRNRALEGQWSWFTSTIVPAEDGAFEVRLPKGDYEVFFTIDRDTYPNYATGRQRMAARVPLMSDYSMELRYNTTEISGPLRVAGEVVRDTIGGPEVGLRMQRQQDFQVFEWGFNGGAENYSVRVPEGSYEVDFVIRENAIDGVAWGNAPMGVKLNVAQQGEPFMKFMR